MIKVKMSLITGTISAYQGGGVGLYANDSSALSISGPAGGALTGTYPNPTLAANSVSNANIVNGTITQAKLQQGTPFGGSTTGTGVNNGDIVIAAPNTASINQAGGFFFYYAGSYILGQSLRLNFQFEFIVTGAIVGPVNMTITVPGCPVDLTTTGIGPQTVFLAGNTSNPSVSWLTISYGAPNLVLLSFNVPNVAQTYRCSVFSAETSI